MKVEVLGRRGRAACGREGRAGLHRAVPLRCRSASGTTRPAPSTTPPISLCIPTSGRHGDYVELTEHGGLVIYGRSGRRAQPRRGAHRDRRDLPPGGEARRGGRGAGDRPGVGGRHPRGAVRQAARGARAGRGPGDSAIRTTDPPDNATPRHVPARIVQVADIPRTISGKIVELAVREVVHGRPVKNIDALANPRGARPLQGPPRAAALTPTGSASEQAAHGDLGVGAGELVHRDVRVPAFVRHHHTAGVKPNSSKLRLCTDRRESVRRSCRGSG